MTDHLSFRLEPMRVADLPAVMAIERLSFSAPWSERAYRYEIEENKHGLMLVALEAGEPSPASSQGPARGTGLLSALRARFPVLESVARRFEGPDAATPDAPRPVVGYGGLWLLVDGWPEAHISTLAVHPEWRGRGLGGLLLGGLLERAMAMGAQRATLEVRVSNHVAQGLYEKYGFDVVGLERRYYSDNNEDAYIMSTPPFETPELQQTLHQLGLMADTKAPTR